MTDSSTEGTELKAQSVNYCGNSRINSLTPVLSFSVFSVNSVVNMYCFFLSCVLFFMVKRVFLSCISCQSLLNYNRFSGAVAADPLHRTGQDTAGHRRDFTIQYLPQHFT